MTFMLLFLALLADVKQLLTNSSRPFVIVGGLCLSMTFVVKTERKDV